MERKTQKKVIFFFTVRSSLRVVSTTQKMKFSSKEFFSKCHQIRRKLRIWSHFLKNFLMENFIFCAVLRTLVLAAYVLVLRRRKKVESEKLLHALWSNQYLQKTKNNLLNGKSSSKKLIILTENTLLHICEWVLNGLRIYLVL